MEKKTSKQQPRPMDLSEWLSRHMVVGGPGLETRRRKEAKE